MTREPSLDKDITVTGNGQIITSNPSTLTVYSSDGVKLGEMPRQEDREKVGNTGGLCVDSEDNVYVVDMERNVVCMLDSNGKYVKDVITGLYSR